MYHRLVTNDCQDIWKARYDSRWRRGKSRRTRFPEMAIWSRERGWRVHQSPHVSSLIQEGNWFEVYIHRCKLDNTVLPRLMDLNTEISRNNHLWKSFMSDGEDIIDKLSTILAGATSLSDSETKQKCSRVLGGINRYMAYQEWRFVNECFSDTDINIETGAIAVAKFYELDNDRAGLLNERVSQSLDDFSVMLTTHLRQRFGPPSQDEDEPYPIRELLVAMQMFFGESGEGVVPFRGNDRDYYNHQNSLIDQCIERRTGIPIALAVIYVSIVRRAFGLQLDLIGLPGHIVVGVPLRGPRVATEERLFVDPFHGGSIISYADCQAIVERYNITFFHEMVTPLTKREVWQRIIRNLIHLHSQMAMNDDYVTEESTVDWKIVVPLRNFLTDFRPPVNHFDDLAAAPGWCPMFF